MYKVSAVTVTNSFQHQHCRGQSHSISLIPIVIILYELMEAKILALSWIILKIGLAERMFPG